MQYIGRVRRGRGLGRKIGYPTANIAVQRDHLPNGVFLCTLDVAGKKHNGLAVIGIIPSGVDHSTVEVHLLDFEGDLYGQEVAVEVGEKIRGVRPFHSSADLVRQIEQDVAKAREMIAGSDALVAN